MPVPHVRTELTVQGGQEAVQRARPVTVVIMTGAGRRFVVEGHTRPRDPILVLHVQKVCMVLYAVPDSYLV